MRPASAASSAAVALLLALPGVAHAGTATSVQTCLPTVKGYVQGCYTTAHYDAGPGEANDVTATKDGDAFVFQDVVPVTAGSGCTAIDEHTARCPGGSSEVRTGDLDDRVAGAGLAYLGPGDDRTTGVPGAVGEEGDDVLAGTPNGDQLDGGPGDDDLRGEGGDDRIIAGPGGDVVAGGEGDDTISAFDSLAATQPDRFDGGPGSDTLSYSSEQRALTIDLAAGTATGGAAGDAITEVENLEGGRGPNVLIGDEGPNELDGYVGPTIAVGAGGDDELHGTDDRDRLDGGDGNDVLDGEAGRDELRGGTGDDRVIKLSGSGLLDGGDGDDFLATDVDPRRPRTLRMRCGEGLDLVSPGRRTILSEDCDRLAIGDTFDGTLDLPLRLRGRYATTLVTANFGEIGELVLRDRRGRRIGSKRWRSRGSKVAVPVKIRLTRGAARRARRTGRLGVQLTAIDLGGDDASPARTAIVAR